VRVILALQSQILTKIKLIDLKKVNSTNDYLKENFNKVDSFTFVKTNYQSNGRGQFDRKWQAKKKKNLLFSFIIKDLPQNQLSLLTTWVRKSIFNVLRFYNLNPVFKNPNDILVNGKKICGILIETLYDQNRYKYVVIGIGLNVNQKVFLNLNATSIYNETKKKIKVNKLFLFMVNELLTNYF